MVATPEQSCVVHVFFRFFQTSLSRVFYFGVVPSVLYSHLLGGGGGGWSGTEWHPTTRLAWCMNNPVSIFPSPTASKWGVRGRSPVRTEHWQAHLVSGTWQLDHTSGYQVLSPRPYRLIVTVIPLRPRWLLGGSLRLSSLLTLERAVARTTHLGVSPQHTSSGRDVPAAGLPSHNARYIAVHSPSPQ